MTGLSEMRSQASRGPVVQGCRQAAGCTCDRRPEPSNSKAILVTGASGFIGSYFIDAFKGDYRIYALARRCQGTAGIPGHPNIHWFCGDIGNRAMVSRIADVIAAAGGVDYVFHFAGYYDFTNRDHPEYQRTNVHGTRFLLENAAKMRARRFVFSSSLTVSEFTRKERILTEQAPPDASIPYARSKLAAEELLKEYSATLPCTVVRLAAVYSDWGEYGPLYALLDMWLSGSWKSRFVAGRGDTTLPYLHVADLNSLFRRVIECHTRLPCYDTLVASPAGGVSHNELFAVVSRYRGRRQSPRNIPVWLAAAGVLAREAAGKLTKRPPFERLWMLRYVDRRMIVDPSGTRERLGWSPKERYDIRRRLFFLMDNRMANPEEWESKNHVMAYKKGFRSPAMRIHAALMSERTAITDEHIAHLGASQRVSAFPHYRTLGAEELGQHVDFVFEMLGLAILSGNRHHIRCYAHQFACRCLRGGFGADEVTGAFCHLALSAGKRLEKHSELQDLRDTVLNEFEIIAQLIADEVEDVYDAAASPGAYEAATAASEEGRGGRGRRGQERVTPSI